MIKKELLVPVGNSEALLQAIHNGADAVYLGGKKFGARKFAGNFTDSEMIEAIRICHLYGVKIYVTVNTLVYEEEVKDFLEYVKFLYLNHVDAVIMQDIGMICLVRECFPNLEVHASTQLNNQTQNDLEILEKLGIKRVVLARELSLDEIKKLKTNMELEVFIHGALCICYSGCCLFSSMVGGRSGNRGECAGSCRLPYQLLENGKEIKTDGDYLLSTKELNTSSYFKELMDSNITSFKIEGRMKSPEYVGFITRFYRTLMDQYKKIGKVEIDGVSLKELKCLFNRDFTKGHLFNETNHNLMNIKSPNHIGGSLGKVLEVNKDKIKIRLGDDINQNDGIRFLESGKGMMVNFLYDERGKLINTAKKNDIIYLDNKIELTTNDKVNKTLDSLLLKRLQDYSKRTIPVSMKVMAKYNSQIRLIVSDKDKNIIEVEGELVQKASKIPVTKEKIEMQLRKVGNTPFDVTDITFDIDENIFISISGLNEIRRNALDMLQEKRMTGTYECPINAIPKLKNIYTSSSYEITVSVQTEDQLLTCLSLPFNRIYLNDFNLFKKYSNETRVFYEMARAGKENKMDVTFNNLLATSLGDLNKQSENLISDYTMNVTNRYSIYYLEKFGVKKVTLSCELTDDRIQNLLNSYQIHMNGIPSVEKIIYGRIDLMIMKHCLLNHLINNGKKPCSLCRNGKTYELKDRKGICYPIVTKNEITHILSSKFDKIERIPFYLQTGIKSFRIQLFDEDALDIKKLYNQIKNIMKK